MITIMLPKITLIMTLLVTFNALALNVKHTEKAIVIDGQTDQAWHNVAWQPMPYSMAGSLPNKQDFNGRYRLLWDENYLYLQAEITDELLLDRTADPLVAYWDDDCLEIFIDSDASGGIHQYNHSAFAYHIALDNQVVDVGDDQKPHLYNEHLVSRWQRQVDAPNTIIWEVAVKMYPNSFTDAKALAPLKLNAKDVIGFMLAYCDNDGSEHREHFMGSQDISPVNGDKNRSWIDADVFGQIRLVP
jgi:hypothetical protein